MPRSVNSIDLAKYSFSIQGDVLIHKTIERSKALSTFANIPPAITGMGAGEASHYCARELGKFGHTPNHGIKSQEQNRM
ncbi:hypothetical protein [Photobacterium sp. GSS17]|uniref:hypothetical protein n=1 Tax=Photobacterium sp. GSS17 TaxID=3020715 RepID=UPI00235EBE8E|nr:hypothetical protein [Photobacterium sp. GSS17]